MCRTTDCVTASASATRSISRSRTSSRSGPRTAGRSGSTECSLRSGRISRWRRRSAPGSMRSASSTRARQGSRRQASPGPPEHVMAAHDHPAGRAGPGPAFAAARARLGLVALLLTLAAVGWWWTVDRMQGMDGGPWTSLGTLGWFLGIWAVMMAAMMFPSLAPTVALYSRMTRDRLAPLLFTAGYLVIWTAAGALAFAGHAVAG